MLLSFLLRSSENMGQKVGKYLLFLPFNILRSVYFLECNVHFAPFCLSSLVANSLLFTPNYTLLGPKKTLFNGYFAPFSPIIHGSKRFIYTIVVHVYA